MSEDYEEAPVAEESGVTGPGAPTPLSALEVRGRGRLLGGLLLTTIASRALRA